MKKLIAALVGVGLVFGTFIPSAAFAQSALQDNLKKIQELTAQLKALQEQILGLQRQQVQIQSNVNQAAVEIIAGLREGSEGDQVTLLQTLLAADAALYPEGKITGFFGPLTRRALQRFQARHGLEAVGFVGPRTRQALNTFIREQFKLIENFDDEIEDDIEDDIEDAIASITIPPLPSDPCGVPPLPATPVPTRIKSGKVKLIQTGNVFIYQDGKRKIIITPNTYQEKDGKKKLLITPGMRIEKDGKTKVIIPCNGATTTPPSSNDTTAPVISDVATAPSQTSATITWKTNEDASGKVYYGTTSPLNLGTAQSVNEMTWWWLFNFGKNHSVNITGLSASTTYYFVVESKDRKGNVATSSQQSFTTTGAAADTTGPSITAIAVSQIGTSTAMVSWNTNENASRKVYYSTTTPLNTSTALSVSNSALLMSHSLLLTGLVPNTTHYFKVESTDGSGNTTLSTESSFATLALDTTAPFISAVAVSPIASTTATVTWNTNEAATSKVYYGTVTPLVLGSASTVSDGSLVTGHSLNLSGLSASTTYYMVVESKDASNNTATSSETSFVTTN